MRHCILITVALTAATLTACHPSSNVQRCDDQIAQQEESVANMGGWLRCDPSYDADEQANCPPTYRCSSVMEWDTYTNGVRVPTAWEWQANLDGYWLQVNAWMLVDEMYAYKAGRIPSYYLDVQRDGVPADIEQEAFQWAIEQTG